jgi:hypothetical protein
MSDKLQAALECAWRLRHEFRGRGEFTADAYAEALARELPDCPAADLARIADVVNRESLLESDPAAEIDIAGEFELPGGRRVAKAEATRAQAAEWLALRAGALSDAERRAFFRRRFTPWVLMGPGTKKGMYGPVLVSGADGGWAFPIWSSKARAEAFLFADDKAGPDTLVVPLPWGGFLDNLRDALTKGHAQVLILDPGALDPALPSRSARGGSILEFLAHAETLGPG